MYRLYNLENGRHYYTRNSYERDFLVNINRPLSGSPDKRTQGWRDEGITGYISAAPQVGMVEIHHLYNTNSGTHLFTEDPQEKDGILSLFPGIWVEQSSLGFAYPDDPGAKYTLPAVSAPAINAAAVVKMASISDVDLAVQGQTAPAVAVEATPQLAPFAQKESTDDVPTEPLFRLDDSNDTVPDTAAIDLVIMTFDWNDLAD